VLDVGSGDGWLASLIAEQNPTLRLRGLDTLVRPGARIPIAPFDGHRIPEVDGGVDVVMFVDVLHHTEDPMELLTEAARVARRAVVIKDHLRNGILAGPTLRAMDWVGNARHGVVLPYNYWSRAQWMDAFRALGLSIQDWTTALRLYPAPLDWIFGRSLHFAARLERSGATSGASRAG
jgi:SAM-dependent methyltransferase